MARAWRNAVTFLEKGLRSGKSSSYPSHSKLLTHSCAMLRFQSSFMATARPWLLQNGGLLHSNDDDRSNCNVLPRSPFDLMRVQHYSKRPKKWQRGPYAFINVGPDEPCPSSQPNEGSVKNRKRKKKMAQRQEFAKMLVHTQIANKKTVKAERRKALKKRWKEGAARARAWAQLTVEANSTKEMDVIL